MIPHVGGEVSKPRFVFLVALCLGLTIGTWCILTYGGLVNPRLLPTPTATLAAGFDLFQSGNLMKDVFASILRVLCGFCLSAAMAVPVGLLAGSSRTMEALVLPLIGTFRYLPAAAFIPLTILWFGIGGTQKVSIIFISIFFYLTLMVADVVQGVRREWVETAITLGATPIQLLRRVIVPASVPGVWDALRTMMGVGWTTIIIAELVNAEEGLGARIQVASRFLRTDQILFVVAVIGLIGLSLDWGFRITARKLFPWSAR